MAEAIINAENPEVVLPGNNGSAEDGAEVTSPQNDTDFDNMSDEDFDTYLKKAYNGELDEAETVSPAGTGAEDDVVDIQTRPTESENVPFKAFATEEEYKADRQKYFDEHIGNRLKDARENSDLLNRVKDVAADYYGGSDDPIKALIDDLENQNAARAGVSREQYVATENDRRDAEAWREQQRQAEEVQRNREAVVARWRKEEAQLKEVVPDFNFDVAMQNSDFKAMVANGAGLSEAYYAVKIREMQNAPAKPTSRRSVAQNAQIKGTKPGSSVNDAMNMSDKDFDSYIRGIMNK